MDPVTEDHELDLVAKMIIGALRKQSKERHDCKELHMQNSYVAHYLSRLVAIAVLSPNNAFQVLVEALSEAVPELEIKK
jgi:hypothetical protein